MQGMNVFQQNVQYLKGVGPQRQLQLQKLHIYTLFDLLWHLPRQYEDFSQLQTPEQMREGEMTFCKGEVLQIVKNRTARGMFIVRAHLLCENSVITAIWFNQPFITTILKEHETIVLKGRVRRMGARIEIHVAHYEKSEHHPLSEGLLPVYSLSEGLNQKKMRQMMQTLLQTYLPAYPEILTKAIRDQEHLLDIHTAWRQIHFPENNMQRAQAHKRLALEEYLLFRLIMKKDEGFKPPKQPFATLWPEEDPLTLKIKQRLPFRLTDAQERVIQEIREDMRKPYAMNRLLEGDVGSGKTLVAAFSMLMSKARQTQSALMAPTEVLAIQHYRFLEKLFHGAPILTACLTSSTPAKERDSILEALEDGSLDILVGTHALLQEDLNFFQLGLVVIDEQHRFGVRQRARLSSKGQNPDVLVMTATPIPRTLALSLYGRLSISVIDELPPGRLPIKTKYLPRRDRVQAYEFVRKRIQQGEQAYVICPLVEESEKQDLLDVHTLYQELFERYGADFKIGMVHGRMSGEEKQQILEAFHRGEIQMLIATTVVEVGVDVPKATVMVIEHAERFGLSQLHQLRGRVGRGDQQSYCILLGEPANENAYQRLLAMQNTNDGFKLADLDLKLRGPGDFWGVRQHGIQDLKILDFTQDQQVIECAQRIFPWLEDTLDIGLKETYLQLKFPYLKEIAVN